MAAFKLGIAAAGYNSLMLVANMGFTSSHIEALNPDMFSLFGQKMILVWACAFFAAGFSRAGGPVWWAFALEKLMYGVGWIQWMATHDALASSYGAPDPPWKARFSRAGSNSHEQSWHPDKKSRFEGSRSLVLSFSRSLALSTTQRWKLGNMQSRT